MLVPLDGSDAAEYAIGAAMGLARQHAAEIVLLFVEHLPAESVELDPTSQTREHMQAYLTRVRDRLRDDGLRAQERVITGYALPESLVKFVETEHIDLIVTSTQGRTSMLRWLLGNQVENALNVLPTPVLLVRPMLHKIVVPLDGSKWSESAIPKAVEIARQHGAELVLLHVYQSPVRSYADQIAVAGQLLLADQPFEQMRDQLTALRNRLRQEGVRAQVQIVHSNNPAQAICEFAESEEGISMVVMSTHGRTGLSRWLLGSVAQRVIKDLRCPVTLVHPGND
ncbi:MAG: universal stress protein [Anaerolineae bacterium]|nr:universal stress protein [Anaerolineae bacterium]